MAAIACNEMRATGPVLSMQPGQLVQRKDMADDPLRTGYWGVLRNRASEQGLEGREVRLTTHPKRQSGLKLN